MVILSALISFGLIFQVSNLQNIEEMTTHPGRMLEFGNLLQNNISFGSFETNGEVSDWKERNSNIDKIILVKDKIKVNPTSNNQSDDPVNFPVPVKATLGVLSALTSLVTVGGNLLVITAFFVERSLRTPTNYFIASLAVTDVLIGMISMNLFTSYVLLGRWPLGVIACNLWLALDYTACLTSQYTVFFITLDRFFSVKIPAKYRNWRTEAKVLLMVSITWFIPAVLFFSIILGWQYFYPAYIRPSTSCYAEFSDNATFLTVLTICYFWVTLVVMSCLYVGIYRVAVDLQKRSDAKRQKVTSLFSMAGQTMSRIGVSLPHHNMDNTVECENTHGQKLKNRNSSTYDSENDSGLVKSQPTQVTESLSTAKRQPPLETSFGVKSIANKLDNNETRDNKQSEEVSSLKHINPPVILHCKLKSDRKSSEDDMEPMYSKYECISLNSNFEPISCSTVYSLAPEYLENRINDLNLSQQSKLVDIQSPIVNEPDDDEQANFTNTDDSLNTNSTNKGCEDEVLHIKINQVSTTEQKDKMLSDKRDYSIEPHELPYFLSKTIGSKPKEEDECHFHFDPPGENKLFNHTHDNMALLKANSPIWKARLFDKTLNDKTYKLHNGYFQKNKSSTKSNDSKNYPTSCQLVDRQHLTVLQKCKNKLCCSLVQKRKAKVERGRSENRARKALRTISFILGAFVFCWTPYHIIVLIHAYDKKIVNTHLYNICYWLCYMNSPINPFCYALANAQFKKTFLRILRFDIWRT